MSLVQQSYAGRSLSWYVAPVAYRMTPIAGVDDLGRTQLAYRGQPVAGAELPATTRVPGGG